MRSRIPWRYTIPTIAMALVLGLALTAFTANGAMLGNKSNGPFVDDGSDLLGEATVSLDSAIATARSAASGPIDNEVDMERQGDRLVYEVEVGDAKVTVDAQDGSVIATDMNDDADENEDED